MFLIPFHRPSDVFILGRLNNQHWNIPVQNLIDDGLASGRLATSCTTHYQTVLHQRVHVNAIVITLHYARVYNLTHRQHSLAVIGSGVISEAHG